jgi:hypothetical protein
MSRMQTTISHLLYSFENVGATISSAMGIIAALGIENGIRYETAVINGTPRLLRFSPSPNSDDECACSVALGCSGVDRSQGNFICQYGNGCTNGSVEWRVPGFVKSCTTIDSMAKSDLRCFFNQSCLDRVIALFNLDMPDRPSLPRTVSSLKALDSASMTYFQPDDKINRILDRVMVDAINVTSNFEAYYKKCVPAVCTYSIKKRLDHVYIIATVIGWFGGMITALRLLVSPCFILLKALFTRRCRCGQFTSIQVLS